MKKRSDYLAWLDFKIKGIPCFIGVRHAYLHKAEAMASSELDYRGYSEIEYDVFDRAGSPANWLLIKIDDATDRLICKAAENELWGSHAE